MADQQEMVLEDDHSEWFRRISARRAVFRPLCEMFPQVDYRIINATILEHGSDMAACVESILNELLLPERNEAPTPLTSLPEASPGIAVELAQGVGHRLDQPIIEQVTEEKPTAEDSLTTHFGGTCGNVEGSCSSRSDHTEPLSPANGLSVETVEDMRRLESSAENVSHLEESLVTACAVENAMKNTGDVLSEELLERKLSSLSFCVGPVQSDVEEACHSSPEQSDVEEACYSSPEQSDDEEAYSEDESFSDLEVHSENSEESARLDSSLFKDAGRHDSGNNDIKGDCSESDDFVGSQLTRDENYSSVYSDIQGTSEPAMWGSMHSSASQAPTIEVLDQKVQEAKSDKDDLIGALAEIRALRLEVERAEAAARQAKVDAANAGAEMLAKAKEVRDQTAMALQANEMHHGEVFGEKAVLGTEARELQARLLQVTEEKTNAANKISQIKAMLHGLLDKAAEEKEAADVLKLANETAAKKALALEVGILENVQLETEHLEREAEDCRKLREFLIESGSVVDSLQGEVAILCEDVEAVKRQVEDLTLSASSGYVTQASMSVRSTQGGSPSTSSKSSTNHGVQMTGVEHRSEEPAETPLAPTYAGSASWSTATAAESGNELPNWLDPEKTHTNVEGRMERGVDTELMSSPRGGPAEHSQLASADAREGTTLSIGCEYVSLTLNLLDDNATSQRNDDSWQLVHRWDVASRADWL